MLCVSHAAKAEITCRSCQPGNKWRARELLLKFDTSESATGLKGEVFGHGEEAGRTRAAASAESRRLLRCAAGSAECAPERAGYAEPRLKRNTDNLQPQGEIGEGEFAEMKVLKTSGGKKSGDGAGFTRRYRKRARRNSDDDDDKVRSPGSARGPKPGEGMSSAAGRRVTRSELRWSGEERRAGPRQEELKLNSSTFALTGDSSHNQAMVHWSGQNSSPAFPSHRPEAPLKLQSCTEASLLSLCARRHQILSCNCEKEKIR
ncbi:VPS10 domain-containing receptor SorCS3 Precursor [Larimichthys crocea]|uniref:VPS10 domain-containing receptor SorCS3 n=1 Tax=Larimichthys crocea TaxID=215358 RepID=A0A6G0JBG6_LARCR|nr:VPS10 domain-containing receptor SorCS3 Precursor [Larimichthys crocea]